MTEQQRAALEQARRLLQPHFPGEQVRLHVPAKQECAAALRIAEALRAGEDIRAISRREDVSIRWVRIVRSRLIVGKIGGGSLPP